MLKKTIAAAMSLMLAASGILQFNVNACERDYAPTSALCGGWNNDSIGRELIAYAKLGEKCEMSGMRACVGDDESAVTVSRALGREGYVLSPDKGNSARYINIDVDKSAAYKVEDGSSYAIEVDYYDNDDISSLAMEYASMDYQPLYQKEASGEVSQPSLNNPSKSKEGEYLIFGNTGVWKTYCWFMDNPTFADTLDGFDCRIGVYSDTMKFSRGAEAVISEIRIYKLDTASRIEITNSVSDEHLGNIFYDGEKIEVGAEFSGSIYPIYNQQDGTYPLDVVYTVKNTDGETVCTKTDTFTLKALETEKRIQTFDVNRFGIYTVDIEAYCREKKIYSTLKTEFSYVHSDKGKTVNPKAGVQIALLSTEDTKIAQLAKNAGIPNVRMMCYYYNWRKSAENYEITNTAIAEGYKSLFRAFKKAGLNIDANLHSASWMGAAYNFSPIERTPPYTEDGLRRWGDYCAMMASLLGDTVECFEIWNEYNLGPNHSFNMENRPASDYAKMYEVSKKAIKAVNPNMPVVGLNTSGAPYAWIEEVLNSGATDMDVLSVHPYQWYGDPLTYDTTINLSKVKEMFKKYGMGDIPLWITEYGYSSHYEEVNTDIEQGMYNAQTYAMIMQKNLADRFYFYCFLDKDNAPRSDRESNFGMVRGKFDNPLPYTVSYAAKPAYLILSNMNMLYADAEFENSIELGDTGRVICSRHKGSGRKTAMMFSNKKGGELVTLNLGTDEITLCDAYGNTEKIQSKSGIYSFDLSKRIQYIEGDFKSFDRVMGGAFPAKTEISAVYGSKIDVPVMNYTQKSIRAKLIPYEGSGLKGTEKEINGETGSISIDGANAVKGTERIRLVLSDADGVCFNGNVYISYKETAQLQTTLIPLETGWSMRCTLTNLSATEKCSGTLTVLTPKEWTEEIGNTEIELNPNKTKTVDIPLPVALVAEDKVIEIGFITDRASKMGSYRSSNYNFSAALRAKTPVKIDGNGEEWTEGFITLNRSDQFHSLLSLGSTYAGPDDLSARAAVKWDDDNFYLFADVLDNKHFSSGVTPVNIWQMDSIQFAVVYDPQSELSRSEFEEIAVGELDGKPVIYRHKTRFKGDGDYTQIPGSETAVKTEGLHTYYEVKIPWSSLMVEKVKIEPGTELKFALVVNENDGVGRTGYLALGDGIVSSKNSSLFKRLYIRN